MTVSEIKITDDEIRWAEQIMQLPEGAFNADRKEALKNINSIDIQACPGSGKTTLLVAKLAILCKKWPFKTRGICVLSHTNAARKEIENRLGNTDIGECLLSFPHFVGTIHGFVNEFISLPWIRSKPWPVNVIDSDLTLKKRWWQLPQSVRKAQQLEFGKEKNLDSNQISKPKPIKSGKGFLGEHTNIYKEIVTSINQSYLNGFFTHGEMFLFANEAINKLDFLTKDLQRRFPYVLIDEAQDCSEMQNQLLSKVFPKQAGNLIRQRFGDGNQAIFNSNYSKAATTEIFPDSTSLLSISNSHRLHSSIAKLSDPFGLIPYGMTGSGGVKGKQRKHTIFLFDDTTINKVLPSYGELIFDQFTKGELVNKDTYAVGMVHGLNNDSPIGAHVQHYLNSYNPNLNRLQVKLNNFTEYIQAGRKRFLQSNEICSGMDLIAKGIIHFLNNKSPTQYPQGKHPYRVLKKALIEKGGDVNKLNLWMSDILLNNFNEVKWINEHFKNFAEILTTYFSITPSLTKPYFHWSPLFSSALDTKSVKTNIYCHEKANRSVDIKLGSIHSIKGQTHLATLVLDTFWMGQKGKTNLAYLIDWLTGSKSGKGKEGIQNQSRLKCHYVAMTRATDLLCLAMPKLTVSDSVKSELETFGWMIQEVK